MLRRNWASLFAGLVTLALQSSCPAAPHYKLLDLGTFGGFSLANDINEAGQIIGQSRHPDGRVEAFRTQPNSPINLAADGLGDIGGGDPQDSYAEAVNDLGQVIGACSHAAFTLADGVFGPASDIGTLGGQFSFGVAINNRGQLAGTAGIVLFDNQSHGFRTSGLRPINPATDDLGTLGGPSSDAHGINSLGQVVGGSSLRGGVIYHAYRTAPDAAINPATDDIGGLGGEFCAASAINDIGQVVGEGFLPNGDEHAFRTAPGAVINPLTDDLGTLGLRSRANDINNSGVVAGYSEVGAEVWHAIVSFPGEPMTDLNALLVNPIPNAVLLYANGLNDSGQIVGEMLLGNGATRAFLLTPIHEPATVNLIGIGLLAVVGAFSNRSRVRLATCCLLWTVLLLTSAASTALAGSGDIYNLGTLGGTESYGYAINASRQVAGYSTLASSEQRAFLYTGAPGVDGHMDDLGVLPISALGLGSLAYGLNASGVVVGDSYNLETSITRAFRYTGTPESGGGMTDVGDLFPDAGGSADSHGRGVNASGQVVGFSQAPPNGSYHAFLVSGGAMADLGTLGGTYSAGYALNDAGQVSGSSSITGDTHSHAFRYDSAPGSSGAMADLGTLPGKTYSQGLAINDVGQVVGFSGNSLSDSAQHAFLYTGTPGSGGAMADLGTLGGTYSVGRAINTSGHVAGDSKTTGGAQHAFLYTGTPGVDGRMIDLDAWLDANNPTEGAKWTLFSAAGVTDTGLITGSGTYNDGPGGLNDGTRAFLLDASALVSTSLPGDYNHDGKVDAADYVVWRKSNGSQSGYNTWRSHFGPSAGSGAALPSVGPLSAAVPEPTTVTLMMIPAAAGWCIRRRRTAMKVPSTR